MYDIVSYGSMIADASRAHAYAGALAARVRPGDVIADIGTGPGIMALLACRAGARRVYAIEPDNVIDIARAAAAENGCSDRIEFIQAMSTDVTLPEPVDGIVADMRGVLPLFERNVSALLDARDRWLRPNGWMIAECDLIWAAPVTSPRLYARAAGTWDQPFGFKFSAAREKSVNRWIRAKIEPEELALDPQCWTTLDYRSLSGERVNGDVAWHVPHPVEAHGIGVWFDAQVGAGHGFSNSPRSEAHVYQQGFFPWPRAVSLSAGDVLRIELRADPVGPDYIWSWRTIVTGSRGHDVASFAQSSFRGHSFAASALRKRDAAHVPVLNAKGLTDRRILELMHEGRTLADIADQLVLEQPAQFSNRRKAFAHIGELSERYSADSASI